MKYYFATMISKDLSFTSSFVFAALDFEDNYNKQLALYMEMAKSSFACKNPDIKRAAIDEMEIFSVTPISETEYKKILAEDPLLD